MSSYDQLHVGIFVIPPFVNKKSDGTYEGIFYDTWKQIKQSLGLQVKETFIEEIRFTSVIEDMKKTEKYDLVIAPYSVTESRSEMINFTRPVMLNKVKVAYIPKASFESQFISLLSENLLIPLLILLTLGICLGLLLYYAEPSRGRARSVMSAVASMFGEMGFVSENAKLKPFGVLIVFIILLISYYSSIFLQAYTTDKFLSMTDNMEITRDNIKGRRFITLDGTLYGEMFKTMYNCDIVNKKNPKEVVETYLQNPNRYDGVILDYETMKYFVNKHSELTISEEQFSNDEFAFPVLKKHCALLNKINGVIVDMQDNYELKKICRKYIEKDDADNCEF